MPTQPPGDLFPNVVEVVVEIPKGSRNKYEWDERSGQMRLDRVLSSAVFYPHEYGYIAGTRSGDGDPTDAIILIDQPTFPGCHLWVRPVGALEMVDEKGYDLKILCVPVADPHYAHIESLEQVPPHSLVEVENFFATYKLLEDKTVEVRGWVGRDRAREELAKDRARRQAE